MLLTHHRKFDCWLQLGGHVDEEDDSLLAAALRESREESGIQAIEPLQAMIFDIGHPPPIKTAKEPAHVHYDIRYLLVARTMGICRIRGIQRPGLGSPDGGGHRQPLNGPTSHGRKIFSRCHLYQDQRLASEWQYYHRFVDHG